MKKLMLILLFSLGLIAITNHNSFSNENQFILAPPANSTIDPYYDGYTLEMVQGTVSIFSINKEGFSRCSGVLIETEQGINSILTAKHCISIDEEMYVEDKLVNFIMTSKDNDLALLLVDGHLSNKRSINLAKNAPIIDSLGYHIGYPNGEIYEQTGPLTRITKNWEFYKMPAMGGCSGGPVFNENSELIGILWGGLASEGVALTEPLKNIKDFLKEVKLYTKWLNL